MAEQLFHPHRIRVFSSGCLHTLDMLLDSEERRCVPSTVFTVTHTWCAKERRTRARTQTTCYFQSSVEMKAVDCTFTCAHLQHAVASVWQHCRPAFPLPACNNAANVLLHLDTVNPMFYKHCRVTGWMTLSFALSHPKMLLSEKLWKLKCEGATTQLTANWSQLR